MKLEPTAASIAALLKAMLQKGAELDAAATTAFGDLIISYTEIAPKAAETIGNIFIKNIADVDSAAQIMLLDLMRQLAQMPVSEEVRANLIMNAQKIDGELRASDHATIGSIAKIFATTIGSILVVAASAVGFKFARKPTLIESIIGKR